VPPFTLMNISISQVSMFQNEHCNSFNRFLPHAVS